MIARDTLATLARGVEQVVLDHKDVPDMLQLVEHTWPGPFGARTYELGEYIGIRVGGELTAMAGERSGIVLDYNVARLFADAETLYSYEGTREMQNLMVGKAVTGFSAFV